MSAAPQERDASHRNPGSAATAINTDIYTNKKRPALRVSLYNKVCY